MIDLIKPPTDNLYKFAALFGLVLFVVGFVFPPWLFYQSSLEYLKSLAGDDELAVHKKFTEERNNILEARKEQVKLELDNLQKRLDNLASSKSNVSDEINRLESAIKDAKKQAETLEDTALESKLNLELKTAQARQQRTLGVNETRNSRLVMVVGWVIAFIGLLIAFAGFIIWYKRVQVRQDEILEMEAAARIVASARRTDAEAAPAEAQQTEAAKVTDVQNAQKEDHQASR